MGVKQKAYDSKDGSLERVVEWENYIQPVSRVMFTYDKACPLLLQRVNWIPFRHYHCFHYHSQCLRTKIKCVGGCGASRQSKSIYISKNKALSLLHQRVNWRPFRHYHYVYYLSQCLRPKIKFVFGGVVVADSPKVFPFLKIKPPLYD